MNDQMIGGSVGTALTVFGAAISVTELQAIISIIATVIGLLITITTGVIIPLIKRIKSAKENDGKISADELIDIMEETSKDLENVNKEIDKNDN